MIHMKNIKSQFTNLNLVDMFRRLGAKTLTITHLCFIVVVINKSIWQTKFIQNREYLFILESGAVDWFTYSLFFFIPLVCYLHLHKICGVFTILVMCNLKACKSTVNKSVLCLRTLPAREKMFYSNFFRVASCGYNRKCKNRYFYPWNPLTQVEPLT